MRVRVGHQDDLWWGTEYARIVWHDCERMNRSQGHRHSNFTCSTTKEGHVQDACRKDNQHTHGEVLGETVVNGVVGHDGHSSRDQDSVQHGSGLGVISARAPSFSFLF